MTRDPRRIAALGLAVVLIVAVVVAIGSSVKDAVAPSAVRLHGLIGSEKAPFFRDQRVVAALRRGGFDVSVSTAGSREIAAKDLTHEDFVFPAGVPAAEKIRRERTGTQSFTPFFTPMAIATWKPIVALLEANGLIHRAGDLVTFDVGAYIDKVAQNQRWKDLEGNTAYPVNKSILITSTDVRKSNSAAMYLSLASYVANDENIVQNDTQVNALIDRLAPLFLRQGFVASSSEEPFDDYLVQGMGKSPMVMVYESQFIQRAALGDGSTTADMELIYPDPTILSKHTLVGLDPDGIRLGDFLTNDPEMRTLATEFGFRTTDTAAFRKFVTDHQLTVPETLLNVIDPPTYETLESMITRLEAAYAGAGLATPAPDTSLIPSPSTQGTTPGTSPGATP